MENENGHRKVIEHHYMKNWQKVMDFRDQSWNSTNLPPDFNKFFPFLSGIENLSINSASPHFSTLSTKFCKFEQTDSHGKSKWS